jgi:hypothetical protein
MRRIFAIAVLAALGFSFTTARADDKKTPEQIKAEQKDKDLKKAHEDIEKDLKAKKIDPAPVLAFLDKLAMQVGLDVKPAKDYTYKVLNKKIPWADASAAVDDKIRNSVDAKTSKIDQKKFSDALTKWINEWKAEKPADKPADPKK